MTVAVAVNDQGRREVLGMAIGASEAEAFWTEFLRSLVQRGLRGVKLLISDDHKGLKAAATRILGATWQRCRVHFARNLLAHARPARAGASSPPSSPPPSPRRTPTARRPSGVRSPTSSGPRCPSWQFSMDEAEHDVLAYMTFCMDASRNARTDLSMTGRQIAVLYPAFGAGLSARWP